MNAMLGENATNLFNYEVYSEWYIKGQEEQNNV